MLYLLCRELTRSWSYTRSDRNLGDCQDALFIVNPLHCESVSWVVGRVDIECCFYYLVATWSFLRFLNDRKRSQLAVSLVFFWLGMLVKEMAIGFPMLATAISFLAINRPIDHVSFKERLLRMVRDCWPIWLGVTGVYFVSSLYMALGTFVGGYIRHHRQWSRPP